MKIFLGADHRGYNLKEKITTWLFDWNYEFEDLGADHFDSDDDYPLFAERVASLVANEPSSRGILLCGSGVGVDATANKFDGIRASVGINPEQVKAGREDDDMNVLVIASDYTDESNVKEIVKSFLETRYIDIEKHERRLDEIEKIEHNN